jgi:hypothetical protein
MSLREFESEAYGGGTVWDYYDKYHRFPNEDAPGGLARERLDMSSQQPPSPMNTASATGADRRLGAGQATPDHERRVPLDEEATPRSKDTDDLYHEQMESMEAYAAPSLMEEHAHHEEEEGAMFWELAAECPSNFDGWFSD